MHMAKSGRARLSSARRGLPKSRDNTRARRAEDSRALPSAFQRITVQLRRAYSLFFIAFALNALAHNPDTSYCRVTITPREVLCKFTYDFLTLQRITTLDSNGDGQVSRAELEGAF